MSLGPRLQLTAVLMGGFGLVLALTTLSMGFRLGRTFSLAILIAAVVVFAAGSLLSRLSAPED